MNRFVIITIGKTHSGKTTFARTLENELPHSLVIDQDNHAEFINAHYKSLLPKQGPNTIKYAITRTIVDYAVRETKFHLILCNSNRSKKGRLELLDDFHKKGFTSILVYFDIPDFILQGRISESQRPTSIFRSATSFDEVLTRQQAESRKADIAAPTEDEAAYLFAIKTPDDVHSVMQKIVALAQD